MIYLLDTSILIVLIKNRPPQVAERIDQLADEDSLAMSFITWAELLRGAEGSQRREATLQTLDALSRQVPVLYPEGPAICRHYALQATALKRQATPIGGNDLWIAAHALALGATLVSHNVREFARIEGLALEDWAAEAWSACKFFHRAPIVPGALPPLPEDLPHHSPRPMGQSFDALTADQIAFLEAQKLFFVATATADSRVNVSPKGMDSLRVLDASRLIWLNLTGSGNETAAHVQVNPRMTLMFCAFEGQPQILRLYGSASTIQRGEPNWEALYAYFEPLAGARQIFELAIERVQTSCGMAVPRFRFAGERTELDAWARRQGNDGLERYWQRKNRRSIDGLPAPIPAVAPADDGPA